MARLSDDRVGRFIAEELLARLALELFRLLKDGRVPEADRSRVLDLVTEARAFLAEKGA